MRMVILGAGGYGRTVADIAEQIGYTALFLDDADKEHPLSSFYQYINCDTVFAIAFGNNDLRLQWIEKLEKAGAKVSSLIHPTAYLSPTAIVQDGVVILPNVTINTNVIIEKGCIINLGAIIDHDCVIEKGCHICIGAIIKGENRIKSKTKIEAGTVVEARKYPI